MRSASDRIRFFSEHPITRLVVGLILFLSGFAESYRSFSQDFSHLWLGAHHGIMIFGLFNMIASIPDIIEGLASGADFLERVERNRKKTSKS
jgi:hypothetical protein